MNIFRAFVNLFQRKNVWLIGTLGLCLGGENEIIWKWMKKIILEYSLIPCLRVLMKQMEIREFKWEEMDWVEENTHWKELKGL